MPQLVSVAEVHALVHHGMPVMQVAGEVQSALVAHESPVGVEPTPASAPAVGAHHDGVGDVDDTGWQLVLWYGEQSSFVEQLGTHDLPLDVLMHRFGWLTLFAPQLPLDTQGWVHQVPWQVLPVGQSAFFEQGSPTCDPPASLEPRASVPPLVDPLLVPLPELPLLEPVVPSPPLDPSSDVMFSVPTA